MKIKRLYVDAELESLLRLAPVAAALAIDEPVASLTYLGGGRYDIDDILTRLASAAPAPQPAGEAQQFALYNLVLSGGRLDFTDESVHTRHSLRELNLAVPFLSNLASKREIKTTPRLAFTLGSSRFDTAAEGTPFAPTRKTDATITLRDLDLKPYLAYWPASLPVRPRSAVLNVDARVAFEETPAAVVRISGTITADKVSLMGGQAQGSELLKFDRLKLVLEDVRPLEQLARLSAVELTAPVLSIARNRAGQLNLPTAHPDATKNIAARALPESATARKDAQTSAPWKVQVASVAVRGGGIDWLDEALPSPARVLLTGVALNASAIALPFSAGAPLRFPGSLGLDTPAVAASPEPTRVSFEGSATDQAADATAVLAAWPLDMAEKYLGQFLLPALSGRLDARLGLSWQAATPDKPQALKITAPELAVGGVLLAQGKNSLVSVKKVELTQVDIDLPGQTFKAAEMRLTQPRARVERDAGKRWMYERWLASPAATSKAQANVESAGGARPPSWAVAIQDALLDGGAMSFSDQAGAKPPGLDKVAKALAERPALQLTVVGASNLEAERDAFQRERLAARLRVEKRSQLAREGASDKEEAGQSKAEINVGPDEVPALLKAVYKKSDLPRPRNVIGMVKDQPVADMEKLLLAGIPAGGEEMRELAIQRGQAVKDYLIARDLPPARLFLGAVKPAPPDAKWTPHAELNLAMP